MAGKCASADAASDSRRMEGEEEEDSTSDRVLRHGTRSGKGEDENQIKCPELIKLSHDPSGCC
jgi:hypothetical protein